MPLLRSLTQRLDDESPATAHNVSGSAANGALAASRDHRSEMGESDQKTGETEMKRWTQIGMGQRRSHGRGGAWKQPRDMMCESERQTERDERIGGGVGDADALADTRATGLLFSRCFVVAIRVSCPRLAGGGGPGVSASDLATEQNRRGVGALDAVDDEVGNPQQRERGREEPPATGSGGELQHSRKVPPDYRRR